ncbi:MAG: hypothetical protein E5Y67_12410 [Mesorhizobium sp.]|uniref:hypothetical protein n=1 Tax=Mesorhizobium sp. TaxID=1871066 RepID=UPI0011F729DF|nr:hypothetical protein [Mesorhizobium sp.]TIM14475.1 MAG: hypothetical protein E5Y67_12410 [Mesorhizobium sp.]
MAQVNGTFSATGTSAVIVGQKIAVRMDFAGTASVDVEVQMPSGAWIKNADGTAITADYDKVYDRGVVTGLRLNCTAHTNNVEYSLSTGQEG